VPVSARAEARRLGNAATSWRFGAGQSYTAFLVDVHTRKLRYFVAVADDLHFTRAATRLFVAQQALSKQIHELEELVGTPLFERTSRKVSLTPAGEVFLIQARAVLAALDAGIEDALRARGIEAVTITVGFGLGAALELTAPILAEFHMQLPESQLELREFPFTESACGLADGSTDVALVRLPVNNPDIDTVPLFQEPLVVALATGHRFAGRASLMVQDILDEPIVIVRTTDRAWQSRWLLDEHRNGKPPGSVTYATSQTEELEIVAAGLACSVTVAAAARYLSHPGVSYVPLLDATPSVLALAWRRDARTPPVDQFRDIALRVRDRETRLLETIEHPFAARPAPPGD
jgi:DNA-binding transcriptional LysR family regulator